MEQGSPILDSVSQKAKKRTAKLIKRDIAGSPAQTRSASKKAGKRGNEDSFASSSQNNCPNTLDPNSLAPKKKKMNDSTISMTSNEGGEKEKGSEHENAMSNWADALDSLDADDSNTPAQLTPYVPPPQTAQSSQQPPLTFNLVEGMFRHFLDEQTVRMNAKTEKLTVAVKAQGGVLSSLSGQVKKLENNSTDMQERMKLMEAREIEREKKFNEKLSQVASQVSFTKLGNEIARAKVEILFFKVPFNFNNQQQSKDITKGWVESCKDQTDINDDIKNCVYRIIAPKGAKKTDTHRMVKVTCVSEDVKKGLLQQLKKEDKLPEGVSITEVYPKKYRNKARDLNRIGNFIRGISNNVVKFKIIIDNYELQLRLKFTEGGDFIVQKSWTPPQGTETAKACIDYGAPNAPKHDKNEGKNGIPLAPSVLKSYARSLQVNSKTNVTDTDFPSYKSKIESEWQNKDQKVVNVLPGGKKSLYVTFDTHKHACEAFDVIKTSKVKYWPQMTTIYMVNFNV